MEVALKELAREQGFDDIGFCGVDAHPRMAHLMPWLEKGRQGDMGYLEVHAEQRLEPLRFMKSARSIIMLVTAYRRPEAEARQGEVHIARYSAGDDYHDVLRKRMYPIVRYLKAHRYKARSFVDTAPVMEKILAARAGLGVLGRNSLLIHPRFGSWVLLSGIATSALLTPHEADQGPLPECRQCGRCERSCPHGAIQPDGSVDARRCLSYLTLETDRIIASQVVGNSKGFVAGCDVCQEVCPENKESDWAPELRLGDSLQVRWSKEFLLQLTRQQWEGIFDRTPVKRVGYRRFRLFVEQMQ